MRVKSAFTGFFTKMLVDRPGISFMMLAIFFIASSFTEHSDRDLRAKQVNLILRQIGHRLLLQAGDSTSRVMPVTEIKEGTFLLRFENEFDFNHDSLLELSRGFLPKTQFRSGYTVTVHDCMTGDIIYGFQINNNSPDLLACSGRSQPPGHYTIEFAFPDFYENEEQKKADIRKLAESVKVDPREFHPKSKASKIATADYVIDQRTEALKSSKADPQKDHSKPEAFIPTSFDRRIEALGSGKVDAPQARPKHEAFTMTTMDYPLVHVVYGGLLLLGATLLIWRFGKFTKPVPMQLQNQAVIKEPVPELAELGKFLFNVKGQHLLLESEVIGLTDKECRVLELLHKNFGEMLPRETLLQEVWINEGVITSRSLDMFISKLRKKLSVDPDLRITNIHGKGYRLETVHDAVSHIL